MLFNVKMCKKEFINGKCKVRDKYYTKEDFDAAMEEFRDITKRNAVYLYVANIIIPALPKDEQARLINNTCIGTIVNVTEDSITVSTEKKYPGFRTIKKYYSSDHTKMEADFEFMGHIEDDGRIANIHIAKMNLFLSKPWIDELNKTDSDDNSKTETKFFRFDMPMTLKPDENDRYYNRPSWGDRYFTKEKLSKIVNSEAFKERLKNGTVFLCIAPPKSENGNMQINPALIAGYVEDVDIENNKITFLCTSNCVHTQIFVNHGDLIGKELFAACMYILSPIKSGLVDTEGNDLCKELDIKDIVCYVLKREKPEDNKPVEEDTTNGN